MASIEREVEKGLLNAVSGVTGVNPYTSERGVARTLPSRAAFDTKFQSIVAELYRSPDLASYMTNVTSCTIYLAKVTGESPSIIARNRTWAREVTLDVNATAKK